MFILDLILLVEWLCFAYFMLPSWVIWLSF